MTKEISLRLNFFADTPAGQKNKFFSFSVKSYDHAIDLAAKFVQEYDFNIRAAYFQIRKGLSKRFDNDYDLKTRENSLIKKSDIEKMLEIAKNDIDFNNNYDE